MTDRVKIGRNSKKRSKVYEREVARRLGVKRNPETGAVGADVYCGPFDVEVKSRAAGFGAIVRLMDEAKRKARPNQTPVLVAVHRGTEIRYLAVMELDDWAAWNGAPDAR